MCNHVPKSDIHGWGDGSVVKALAGECEGLSLNLHTHVHRLVCSPTCNFSTEELERGDLQGKLTGQPESSSSGFKPELKT